jgi:uncharacterized protein YjgD (DUF1641 family)
MPISSKTKQLNTHEVIIMALKDMKVEQKMITPALLGIVQQASIPDTDTVQFGNTVFISTIKSKNNVTVAYLRAMNADTARNYLNNGIEYFKYIIEKGVSYVFMTFTESSVVSVLNAIKDPDVQEKVGLKAKVAMKKSSNGNYTAVVRVIAEGEAE